MEVGGICLIFLCTGYKYVKFCAFDSYFKKNWFLGVFGGGGTSKVLISFVQIPRMALEACGGVQNYPLSNPLVAWSLVVTKLK